MKVLLRKILLFSIPFIVLLILFVTIDPFRVFVKRDRLDDAFISINRSYFTYKTYLKNKELHKFDSFIFGSSLSLSFKLSEWKKYLPKESISFHFDGSGEGMYGIYHKIKYLDKDGANLNNVLIILEKRGLSSEDRMNGKGMMDNSSVTTVAPPEISGEPFFIFYTTYLKKAFDLKFVAAYLDYTLFNTHRPYMNRFFEKKPNNKRSDSVNADFQIPNGIANNKKDSLAYYKKRIDNGIFYQRPVENDKKYAITDKEIEYLQGIKEVFDKHQTDYRIVLAPTYDQVSMPKHQLNLLYKILGKEHIYNFTGKNKFTKPISNFFESDHYKPYVANEILSIIYNDKDLPALK